MKKVFGVFLTIALAVMLSVAAVHPAQGATEKQTWSQLSLNTGGQTAEGYCPHCCDSTDQTVTWKVYTRPASGHDTITTGGHYFLNRTTSTNGALKLETEGMDFVLHLNGYTLERNAAGGNVTGVIVPNKDNVTFSVVDNKAQKGTISGGNGGWVVFNSYAGASIKLYSGKLTTNVTTLPVAASNANGGTIRMTGGTFDMYGGTVNGTKAVRGGAIYAYNTAVNIYGGTITGGNATYGGNIYLATATSALVFSGGTIQNGTALETGGNVCANSGTLTLGGTVSGGKAQKGSDIFVSWSADMTVGSTFGGEAGVYYDIYHLPATVYGGTLTPNKQREADKSQAINRNTGVFQGKLYLENAEDKPLIYAVSSDNKMHIASVALIGKDGVNRWYTNNADAVANYDANTAYLKATAGDLVLNGGNYVVDLCGNDVTVTGTGNVTCFDSANADHTTYGKATVNGPALQNGFKTAVAGKDVYMVESGGAYTFHYLDMKLEGVSVRTGEAGIYYTGNWVCDDLLASKILRFGVAVSAVDMPKENFATDCDVLYTAFTQDQFTSGKPMTGAVITNIVKEGESQNDTRANKKIHAAAYITFQDATVTVTREDTAYSLYDIMELLEWKKLDYVSVADQLKDFQDTWKDRGVNWDFDFDVSDDAKELNTVYAERTAYHGEFHDHAATGGNSDGHYTLEQWKRGMDELDMDFATILDHKQTGHMSLDSWDDSVFMGGSEAAVRLTDYLLGGSFNMHFSMIFSNETDLINTLSGFSNFSYKASTKTFDYPMIRSANMSSLINIVKKNGGMFVHVHPKADGYLDYTDPLKYYFADWTGLEVFYGNNTAINTENYQLWVDLLAKGKKIWATAGSDKHAAPSTSSLTTIYSHAQNAEALLSYAKTGDLVCGPVGIRMCVGDTTMGSQTAFAGKRLIFSVSDFHESAYDATHTYRVDLISDTGKVYSAPIDGAQPFYFGMDADNSAKFYRVEVFDETANNLVAIGNPIWNN